MASFKANNYCLDLSKKTYVMGILNVTPDSFSDGGKYNDIDSAVARALEIQSQGADILDIGAQSTKPGFKKISADEELKRLLPVLEAIKGKINIPISIDTFYPKVADTAIGLGADIINDVMGWDFEGMLKIASKTKCGLVIMHVGSQINDIKPFFISRLKKSTEYFIDKERLCFDPGIGFGKNYEDDVQAIKQINEYKIDGCAVLIGASKKRLIGHFCDDDTIEKRLPGTIAVNAVAALNGANIVRVHDVIQTVNAMRLVDELKF